MTPIMPGTAKRLGLRHPPYLWLIAPSDAWVTLGVTTDQAGRNLCRNTGPPRKAMALRPWNRF